MKQTNKLLGILIAIICCCIVYYFYNQVHQKKLAKNYLYNKMMYNLCVQNARLDIEAYGKVSEKDKRDLDSFYILVANYEANH